MVTAQRLQAALAESKVTELSTPTLNEGETYADLREMYGYVVNQWATELGHVARIPGGLVIANIMACATSLSTRFDLGVGEPLLYGFAAAVGVGRIIDRGHWASDQVVGVVFAYAIGREVAMRQRYRLARSREAGVPALTEIPRSTREGFYFIRDESRGLGLGWQRRF